MMRRGGGFATHLAGMPQYNTSAGSARTRQGRKVNVQKGLKGFQPTAPKAETSEPFVAEPATVPAPPANIEDRAGWEEYLTTNLVPEAMVEFKAAATKDIPLTANYWNDEDRIHDLCEQVALLACERESYSRLPHYREGDETITDLQNELDKRWSELHAAIAI